MPCAPDRAVAVEVKVVEAEVKVVEAEVKVAFVAEHFYWVICLLTQKILMKYTFFTILL